MGRLDSSAGVAAGPRRSTGVAPCRRRGRRRCAGPGIRRPDVISPAGAAAARRSPTGGRRGLHPRYPGCADSAPGGVGATRVPSQAPWLLRMLPADPGGLINVQRSDDLSGVPGPISVTALRLRRGAAGGPMGARWRWGSGSVLLWAFDPFAPALRSWSGRAAMWTAALDAPVRPWVAPAEMGDALPASRPLAGSVQVWLLVLSGAYILAVRRALRRAGRVRGGWLAVPMVATIFALAMYGFALQARRAGTSVVQVSITEVIPGTGLARVRTFAALISPYGGTFHLRAAEDAWMQPAEPRPLTFDAPFAISGNAATSGLRVDR